MNDEPKRAPINTEQQAKSHPELFLAEALVVGTSKTIENQERRGQESFVGSDTLPADLRPDIAKAVLEQAGTKFLGPVQGDPMFEYVELPAGWKKVATDHAMWSKLVDAKGRERAAIFYKAASYDRSAFLSLTTRFSIESDYDLERKEHVAVTHVLDAEQKIYSTNPVSLPAEADWTVREQVVKVAQAWLEVDHPNWRDPGAYWE